jgi:N-acetylneuraminate synthase
MIKELNGYPDIIIELGINHQGDRFIAKDMIEESFQVLRGYPGRIFWKLQKRTPDLAVPEHMKDTPRKSLRTGRMGTYLRYKREIEFGSDDLDFLLEIVGDLCGSPNLFLSVWDIPSVNFVTQEFDYIFNMPYIKIPSAHLTNIPLIKAAANTRIPLILSTGMSTALEIDAAVSAVPKGVDLTILSCTATYPCPDQEVNLTKILTLRERYGHFARIGFSSHSTSPMPAIYSALFGAEAIEVHYTLDRAMEGSDHSASLESKALELLSRELARLPELWGSGELVLMPGEIAKKEALRG